jgi:histone deacetylase 1/2
MTGDGTRLSITHTGSTSLLHSNKQFSLTDVLYVPSITKNLISISKFYISNNASIEFLPFLFLVKDLHTGATLLKGKAKDGVYE